MHPMTAYLIGFGFTFIALLIQDASEVTKFLGSASIGVICYYLEWMDRQPKKEAEKS